MRIEERTVGKITVLQLRGKITFGEGDELIKDTVRRLLGAGKTLVVMDLADVPYIDSSGLMEIAGSHTLITRSGGRLWLADPSERIRSLLSITKLLTVFEFVSSDDVDHLQYEGLVAVACPMCEPETHFRVGSSQGKLVCPVCETEMNVTAWAPAERDRIALCRSAVIPTYEGERLTFAAGNRDIIGIDRRLDLFVSEFVERLWKVLPAPRCVEFHAMYANCTQSGLQKIVALCRRSPDGGAAGLRMPDLPEDLRARLRADGALVLVNWDDAWKKLRFHGEEWAGLPVRMWRT